MSLVLLNGRHVLHEVQWLLNNSKFALGLCKQACSKWQRQAAVASNLGPTHFSSVCLHT